MQHRFQNLTCRGGQAVPKVHLPRQHFHLPCHSFKQRSVTLQGLCPKHYLSSGLVLLALFLFLASSLATGKWLCCLLDRLFLIISQMDRQPQKCQICLRKGSDLNILWSTHILKSWLKIPRYSSTDFFIWFTLPLSNSSQVVEQFYNSILIINEMFLPS